MKKIITYDITHIAILKKMGLEPHYVFVSGFKPKVFSQYEAEDIPNISAFDIYHDGEKICNLKEFRQNVQETKDEIFTILRNEVKDESN